MEQAVDQDKQSQQRTDAVAEYEIAVGFRVKEVPKNVREALQAEGVEAPVKVRFSRVNPFRRAAIGEAVQRRFHQDLRNPDILSNAQVLKLVEERGEWSHALQTEMDHLQETTTREMGRLWAEGLTPETSSFADDIFAAHTKFTDLCKALPDDTRQAVLDRFNKWISYYPQLKDEPRFQGYDEGMDYALLFDAAPGVEAQEVLAELEDLKDKQSSLVELNQQRLRLAELQQKHARIFSDTAESRREQSEQMAQLYWTCERADADGKPQGRLTAAFDQLWNWPDTAVQWLLYEAFFFHNNVPDVAREYLGAFGFFTEGRENIEPAKPDESPEVPSSKTDTAPVAKTPANSSESVAATS